MSSYLFTELLLHWATFSLTERPLCWGTSSLSYFFSELLHICSELRSSPATSSLSYFSSSVCNPILLFARVRFRVHIFFLKLSNLFLSQNRSIVCFIWFCFIIIMIMIIIIIINVSRWYQFLCTAMTIQFCSLQLQSGMATYNLFSNLQLQSRMAGASQRWQCGRFRTGRARRAPNFFLHVFLKSSSRYSLVHFLSTAFPDRGPQPWKHSWAVAVLNRSHLQTATVVVDVMTRLTMDMRP